VSTHFKEVKVTPAGNGKYHHVTREEACDYVSRFIDEFYPKGVRTVGGYLSKTALLNMGFCSEPTRHGPGFDGLLMWFCLRKSDQRNAFLAFERDQTYDVTEPYNVFDSSHDRTLRISTDLTLLARPYNREEVEKIVIHGDPTNLSEEQIVTSDEVKAWVEEFGNNFMTASEGTRYNRYPMAFWVKEEVEEVLRQEGVVGVRYYFGYDPKVANRIRVVLVGVKGDGTNLITLDDDALAILLQRSFPPGGVEDDCLPFDVD